MKEAEAGAVNVVIPGRAVALGRPRINMGAIRRFKGAGKGGGPLVYTPYKCKKWQKYAGKIMRDAMLAFFGEPTLFSYPVEIQVTFYLKRPGTRSKFALRPDIDNYVKNLMDAMDNNVFEDDAFVVRLVAQKIWVSTREKEQTKVIIMNAIGDYE